MFKMTVFAPEIAQDRVISQQSQAKTALAHAKTVIMCATAYAKQAKHPRTRQQRLNASVVLKAHQTAAAAMQQAEELEDAVRHGVTR